RKLPSHFDPDFRDIAIGNGAVGPREIDVFENAEGPPLMFWKGLQAREPVPIDDHDFAGLDVANKFGVNQIQGASLAGEYPGVTELAQTEWPETVRIAHAHE